MYEVSKEFRFEAAHSLPHLPEGHKCRRMHGHSYRFEVVCRGPLDGRGFVIDYAEISEIVNPIVEDLDHQNLNELFATPSGVAHLPSTAEQLAKYLYDTLKHDLDCLHQIHLYETAKTRVTYPI